LKLFTYFRSSAAYRVRIALNLKGLAYEAVPVHLLRDGGQQHHADYRARSPLGNVPALEIENGDTLTQSLAIIEYVDEIYRESPLLPAAAECRARVRALSQTIACDIHPLNNLRVLRYLVKELGITEEQKDGWYRHWVNQGLAAVETLLANDCRTGDFCHGDAPTMADCCLVPQVFNARRFNCSLADLPTIRRIVDRCEQLPAFRQAAPDQQADAE
jgi:maleylacetoacetate isomerase